MKIGFNGHKLGIEERMGKLSEESKVAFLRSFYTSRRTSQEYAGSSHDFFDSVYAAHCRRNRPIDSNEARNRYTAAFIQLMTEKQIRGNVFNTDNFAGKIVASESEEGKEYFVQRNVQKRAALEVASETRPAINSEKYNCSCPHGYREMYEQAVHGKECKHIKDFRRELSRS